MIQKYLITTFGSCTCYLGRGILCSAFFQSDPPVADCQNSCCESNPCLNGGTCRESCDVIGRRFTCKCGPHSYGKLCEGRYNTFFLPSVHHQYTTGSISFGTTISGVVWVDKRYWVLIAEWYPKATTNQSWLNRPLSRGGHFVPRD